MNGNPSKVNIKQLCGRIRRRRYNLILAESKFKTPCSIIKDKYMMKAQVHVSKSSAISDVQALPRRKYFIIKWMAYEEFSEFLKNSVGFAHSLYYKVPNVDLEIDDADTTIMDRVFAKWRGPPKTRHCNKFLVADLVNCAKNEVKYDAESMQTEEDAVQTKQIEIGLTDQVERATQDKAVQGKDNQQQQQDNPETIINVE
nr:hypothetical protein [Tanacetum cinerariifolium]